MDRECGWKVNLLQHYSFMRLAREWTRIYRCVECNAFYDACGLNGRDDVDIEFFCIGCANERSEQARRQDAERLRCVPREHMSQLEHL